MKKKISKRLMGTATLAILVTVLLMVAVCYNLFKNQVMDDLRVYAKLAGSLLNTDVNVPALEQELFKLEEELK